MAGVRKEGRLPVLGFRVLVLILVLAGGVCIDLVVQLGGAVVLLVGRILDVLHTWRLIVLEAAEKRQQRRSKTRRYKRVYSEGNDVFSLFFHQINVMFSTAILFIFNQCIIGCKILSQSNQQE